MFIRFNVLLRNILRVLIIFTLLHAVVVVIQRGMINLVLPEANKEDTDAFMKAHLCDDNFKGEIQERFDSFIQKVTGI